MKKYQLPNESQMHARIGFETPMTKFTTDFYVPGKPQRNHPRSSVSAEFLNLPVPYCAHPGFPVPLIYIHAGQVLFSTAKWGIENLSLGTTETFREAERRTLECPGIIPASYVDLTVPGNSEEGSSVVRLLPRNDWGKLYLACVFRRDQMYRAESVSLLVCEPQPDVARHIGWQPLFMPISPIPENSNFDFILGRDDGGALQVPSRWSPVGIKVVGPAVAES
jgi:hypothetical protein